MIQSYVPGDTLQHRLLFPAHPGDGPGDRHVKPGEFVHTLGDAHLYLSHLEQADEQLKREPLTPPKMLLNPNVKDIFGFRYEDFELLNYQAHPSIPAPIAV